MTAEEKYDLIERYLRQELAEEERLQLEARLTADPEWRAEVDLHRSMAQTLKGAKVHQLRSVLEKVDADWQQPEASPSKTQGKVFSLRRIISLAAAVVLLFLGYQYFGKRPLDSTALLAQHFEPYPMLLNQRSTEEATLNTAVNQYLKGEYAQAAQSFQTLPPDTAQATALLFYRGVALLAAQRPQAAIEALEQSLPQATAFYVEQIRWYLALAYLQAEEPARAAEILATITPGQYQYGAAQILRQQMKQLPQ